MTMDSGTKFRRVGNMVEVVVPNAPHYRPRYPAAAVHRSGKTYAELAD